MVRVKVRVKVDGEGEGCGVWRWVGDVESRGLIRLLRPRIGQTRSRKVTVRVDVLVTLCLSNVIYSSLEYPSSSTDSIQWMYEF